MLSEITWKDFNTIKRYFSRNKMGILEKEDIISYIKKYAL